MLSESESHLRPRLGHGQDRPCADLNLCGGVHKLFVWILREVVIDCSISIDIQFHL